MNLNIIGNGFDLCHGLPSSYYYFGCYLDVILLKRIQIYLWKCQNGLDLDIIR